MTCNTWRQWVPARTWFLFNTWFSLLVICASAAATLHVPISRAAWPILLFCCGLVFFQAMGSGRDDRTTAFRWRILATSVLFLGAVVVVLWRSLINGNFVSVFPDPWAYTALAAYVQNPLPPTGAGLQPILSFGRHLMGTRFGTAGLLALFAQVSGTDPCRSACAYAFLVLLQTGLGFTLLARALRAGPFLSLGAGLFGVASGWVPEILKIGNWDHVLFVSFIPFILLRFRLSTLRTSRGPGILAFGLCLGAAAYAYPEGTAISGVIYLPLVVWRLLRGNNLSSKLRRLVIASAIALLVTSAYLPTFVIFLRGQIVSANTVLNAKGLLAGLVSKTWLPAVYCLGEQIPAEPLHKLKRLDLLIPEVFILLTFVALGTWWKRKDGVLLTIPVFLLLGLWEAVQLRYDYGFYKVLTMFWPVMVTGVFVGMSRMLRRCRGLGQLVAAASFCGLMAGAFFVERSHFRYSPWREERRMKPFLELTGLKRISGDAPIRIITNGWFNQMWAVFFLQEHLLEVPIPLLYMQDPAARLRMSVPKAGEPIFLLTDEKRPESIWHNEIFFLLRLLFPIDIWGIDAPNGVETVEGDQFIWLNNQLTSFRIGSDTARQASLVIPTCWPGPSRPGDKYRTLMVEVNGVRTEIPVSQNLKVPLTLRKGENLLSLCCKEKPTVEKLASGDTRILLLGIKGFTVRAGD